MATEDQTGYCCDVMEYARENFDGPITESIYVEDDLSLRVSSAGISLYKLTPSGNISYASGTRRFAQFEFCPFCGTKLEEGVTQEV